jgi:hypothetical protein
VSQRRVLEHQAGAAATGGTQDSQEQQEQATHRLLRLMGVVRIATPPARNDELAKDTMADATPTECAGRPASLQRRKADRSDARLQCFAVALEDQDDFVEVARERFASQHLSLAAIAG